MPVLVLFFSCPREAMGFLGFQCGFQQHMCAQLARSANVSASVVHADVAVDFMFR